MLALKKAVFSRLVVETLRIDGSLSEPLNASKNLRYVYMKSLTFVGGISVDYT